MKKSYKPLIVLVASLLVVITIILLISQGLRFKYEELQREFAQLGNQIKTEKAQMVNLRANHQMLSAEDVIKKYASIELGLIETESDSEKKITLFSEDIVKLSESLEDLNE
jgi:cell division protein FtsB